MPAEQIPRFARDDRRAGHEHRIRARAFSGRIVHFPDAPSSSRLEITIRADSLEVLTPPDTAEIRKVTEAMRTEVLHVEQYPEITLVGQTRDVPIDVAVQLGADRLRATGKFEVKQTDFGIEPYSGGPLGTVGVADSVKFDIELVAVRVD